MYVRGAGVKRCSATAVSLRTSEHLLSPRLSARCSPFAILRLRMRLEGSYLYPGFAN